MKITNIFGLKLVILLLLNSGIAASSNERRLKFEVLPVSNSEVDRLSATAFAVSLTGALEESGSLENEPAGVYEPTFNVLFVAFTKQIQIWRELQAENDRDSLYMSQLIEIDDAGYLKEYLWSSHSNEFRGRESPNLRLTAFRDWFTGNIDGHTPRIEARLILSQ